MYRRGDSPVNAEGVRLWARDSASSGAWLHQKFPGQPSRPGSSPILWQRVLLPRMDSAARANSARTLRFRSVDQIFEVYLNGRVIYRMGNPDRPGQFITAGTTLHLVDLGEDFSHRYLHFRIYSRSTNRGLNGRVFIGARSDHLAGIIRHESHRVVFSILFLLVGLVLFSAYLSRRIDPAYPYFAFFLICMGVWTISQTELKQLFLDKPIFWRFADLSALFFLPVGILGFYEKVFSAGYLNLVRHARRFHIVYGFAAPALIFAMVVSVRTSLIPFQAVLVCELAFLTGYSAVVAYRGDKHARIFFAVFLMTVLLGLHDVFTALGWLSWSPPLSFWSVFALMMVCGVILGHRYFDMQAMLALEKGGRHDSGESKSREERGDESSANTATAVAPSREVESPPAREAEQPAENNAGVSPPPETLGDESFMGVLRSGYRLTAAEARVCREIREGKPREEIALMLGIKPSTLKIHLKSIYGKTIEKGHSASSRNRDKLQRLTVFLHDLSKSRGGF